MCPVLSISNTSMVPLHEFLHVQVTKLEKVIASSTFCSSNHRRLLYWGIIPRGLSPTTISDSGLKGCKCFAETVLHSGIPLFLKVSYCHQGRRFTSTDRHPSEQRKRCGVTSNFHERLWTQSYCQRIHLDEMNDNHKRAIMACQGPARTGCNTALLWVVSIAKAVLLSILYRAISHSVLSLLSKAQWRWQSVYVQEQE